MDGAGASKSGLVIEFPLRSARNALAQSRYFEIDVAVLAESAYGLTVIVESIEQAFAEFCAVSESLAGGQSDDLNALRGKIEARFIEARRRISLIPLTAR